jgi:hypothetical protein
MDEHGSETPEMDLEEFLRLLPHLEAADLLAMSAAYQRADASARDAARAAASGAAKDRKLGDDLARLQGSIIQWAGSDLSRTSALTLEGLRTNPMLGDIRVQAVPPLLDAATALLLKDALSDVDRAALIEPFGTAIG